VQQSVGASSPYFRTNLRLSTPIRLAPEAEAVRNPEGTWLVLEDVVGLSSALIRVLSQRKQNVVTVCPGETFARRDQNSFELSPGSREHYLQLFRTLAGDGVLPHTIVYCPTVTGKTMLMADAPTKLRNIFENLMLLTGEIGKFYDVPLRLFVMCDQLHSITGDEVVDPFKSTVLGVCRVAPLEIHSLACRCIDLVVPEGSSGLQAQAELLIDEMWHESSLPVIAYRGSNRWELFFDSAGLRLDTLSAPVMRERGVYIITGGFGGIGIELALLLARKYKARLALIGRTKLPDPAARDQWIAEHGENDPISIKLAKIAAMESAGAEVLALAADVTSREQMEAAIATVQRTFGEIHGALHLAAVPGGGLMLTRTPEAASEVFTPKVQGTLILEELLRGHKLDFLLLFSSTFAITGAIGQADYCAACAFVSAFAGSQQRSSATPIIAVDWDGWQVNTWQQRIQAFTPEVYLELQQKRERFGISIEEGLQMIEQAVQAVLPQIIASRQDFPALVSRLQTSPRPAPDNRTNQHEQRTKDPHSVRPRNSTEEIIAQIWQEILGLPEIGVNDNFFQLGGHSLFAIQIAAQIREKFQVELDMRKMLEQPTIASLAELVDHARVKNENELDQIMGLLDDISKLSPTEVREQLTMTAAKDN
jgi:NAD(P)-dependent dehydrogenase (short-subunit alcohol dehydrogenase family)/acyl carrier protein